MHLISIIQICQSKRTCSRSAEMLHPAPKTHSMYIQINIDKFPKALGHLRSTFVGPPPAPASSSPAGPLYRSPPPTRPWPRPRPRPRLQTWLKRRGTFFSRQCLPDFDEPDGAGPAGLVVCACAGRFLQLPCYLLAMSTAVMFSSPQQTIRARPETRALARTDESSTRVRARRQARPRPKGC